MAFSNTSVRRSFTRFRPGGVATQAITFGYLELRTPAGGAPKIFSPTAQKDATVTASIKLSRKWDVRIGDILKESYAGRAFLVLQTAPNPGFDLLYCAELMLPIPDEFNAQASIEPFWSTTASGFAIDPLSFLSLIPPPAATLPSGAKGCYQLVTGNFDIWARLRPDTGSVGNVRIVLLGARHPSTNLGCFIGSKDDGTNQLIRRFDEHTVSTLAESGSATATTLTFNYYRIRRDGTIFTTYFKNTAGEPTVESDWTLIFAASIANSYRNAEPIRVGAWGYTNNSNTGEAYWDFIRNWPH